MSLPVVCGRDPVFFFELNVKILTGSHADHGIYFTDADIGMGKQVLGCFKAQGSQILPDSTASTLFEDPLHIGGVQIDMICYFGNGTDLAVMVLDIGFNLSDIICPVGIILHKEAGDIHQQFCRCTCKIKAASFVAEDLVKVKQVSINTAAVRQDSSSSKKRPEELGGRIFVKKYICICQADDSLLHGEGSTQHGTGSARMKNFPVRQTGIQDQQVLAR